MRQGKVHVRGEKKIRSRLHRHPDAYIRLNVRALALPILSYSYLFS
jgi:hypothetical protein